MTIITKNIYLKIYIYIYKLKGKVHNTKIVHTYDLLEKDGLLNKNLKKNIFSNYCSLASPSLYEQLSNLFKKEEIEEFLIKINELTTIRNNKKFTKVLKQPDTRTFLSASMCDSIILAFTILNNILHNESLAYSLLTKCNNEKDRMEFYDDLLSHKIYLNVTNANLIYMIIKKYDDSKRKQGKQLLEKIKEAHSENTNLVKKVDLLLSTKKEFYTIIEKIQKTLEIKEQDLEKIELGHYTSLGTIPHLITNQEDEKQSPYLRLSNCQQQNDPSEGQVLLNYLNILQKNKKTFTYWFSASATTNIDTLPMWKQYGDDASGVMLIYHSEYLKNIIQSSYMKIFKIAYVNVENDKIKIKNRNLSDSQIKDLEEQLTKLSKLNYKKINIPVLNNISFLFKEESYSYENEYRFLMNTENNIKDTLAKEKDNEYFQPPTISIETNIKYNFPFLYSYFKYAKLKYSKVILGPKAINIDFVAPYIYYCNKNIKIEESKVSYR